MYALTAKAMRYMDEYTISKGLPSAAPDNGNASWGLIHEIISRFPDKDTEFSWSKLSWQQWCSICLCVARWLICI